MLIQCIYLIPVSCLPFYCLLKKTETMGVKSSWYLQDLTTKPQYLVTFTVGYNQRSNIDAAVKKVSFSLSLSLSLSPPSLPVWEPFFHCYFLVCMAKYVIPPPSRCECFFHCFFLVCMAKNIILTVFKELYNPSISLRWPNNWMGRVWVVKASYSCERS